MIHFGYKAVMEQNAPSELLKFTSLAQQFGFEFVSFSDHFHPWVHTHGESGFAWVCIASALERTQNIQIGTGVTAPIYRYNPAIIAQAFATLGQLYPGRVFLGLGTGEGMNEIPLGMTWPPPSERIERLEEAIKIIKSLWEREFVTFQGKYFSLRNANLYTKPARRVKLYVAAIGPRVARIAGKYGDGLFTVPYTPISHYKEVLFPALEQGASDSGKDPNKLEKWIEVVTSYDDDYDRAFAFSSPWASTAMPNGIKFGIGDPRELEQRGRDYLEEFQRRYFITTSVDELVKRIELLIGEGFDHVVVSSKSPNEYKFLEDFGRKGLPYLKENYGQQEGKNEA